MTKAIYDGLLSALVGIIASFFSWGIGIVLSISIIGTGIISSLNRK